MRFFFKVLVLIGLIVVSRLEKQAPIKAKAQLAQTIGISLPRYSQHKNYVLPPVLTDTQLADTEKDIQPISYHFSY
jgi:hypothetical protein